MPTQFSLEKSAQAWCGETTKNTEMDVVLATSFAEVLDKQVGRMKDEAEFLWIVLANVSGGDWTKQTNEWQVAAAKARDSFHALCSEMNQKPA